MLITKHAEITKQGFCKILLLVLIQFLFQSHCLSSGWGGGGRSFEFNWEEEGVGWALIRGWVLINFFCL